MQNAHASIVDGQVIFTSPKYSAVIVTVDQNPPYSVHYHHINGFNLYTNNPNPFSTSTMIKYDIPQTGHVILRVLDSSGRIVAVLVDEKLGAGSYQAEWSGKDDDGNDMKSGLYIYELHTSSYRDVKKMSLVR